MASQIRFKFKNAKDSDVIYFEGVALPLEALKAAIVDKKSLAESGVDLIVADAATGACARCCRAPCAARARVPRARFLTQPPLSSPPTLRARAGAEFGAGATIPKNASVTVRIRPPPASKMGGGLGGGGAALIARTAVGVAPRPGIMCVSSLLLRRRLAEPAAQQGKCWRLRGRPGLCCWRGSRGCGGGSTTHYYVLGFFSFLFCLSIVVCAWRRRPSAGARLCACTVFFLSLFALVAGAALSRQLDTRPGRRCRAL